MISLNIDTDGVLVERRTMKKKKTLTTIAVGTLALTSVIGVGASAFAAENGSSSTNKKAPTAAQIAEHEAKRAEKMEEKLTKAVEAGDITEAQKTAILDFFEENKPAFDADATRDERRATMEEFKGNVEAFADTNDIDLDLLKPKGPGGHPGPGGHRGQGGPGLNY